MNTPFATLKIPQTKSNNGDLSGTIKKYLFHWPLFIIGLGISMTALYFYLKKVVPVYEVKATLLIQDEKKAPNQPSPLREIDQMSSSKLIENEIEIFKSKQLIDKVVQDLDLGVVYKKRTPLLLQDLYKESPVQFTLIKPTGDYSRASVNLIIKDKKSFYITMPSGQLQEFFFKDTFDNRFGTWKLEPTNKLEQNKGANIIITLTDPEQLALAYQKMIGVNLSNKLSTAVVLSVDDQVPQRGKDILTHLIQNYNEADLAGKDLQTRSTLDFLDRRIASLSGELNEAEKGIAVFKSARGMTDIAADSKISLESMQKNDIRLNEVNVQLSVIEGIEKYVNSNTNPGEAPTTFGITDLNLTSLIQKLSELQLERDRLLATTPAANPKFETINRQIATIKSTIKENVGNIKSSLLSSIRKLQSIEGQFKTSIRNVPTQEREFISRKRQQAIKENLYIYLLQKREEISVTYASSIANDRIIDKPYSGGPKNSMKSIAFALALLLGLGAPAGFIYARGLFNPKVTSREELKDAFEIPVLAEIPFEGYKKTIAVNEFGPTAISEQFRALRIKLQQLYTVKGEGRVTMVTSSIPGEGKSFVTSNLGVTLAYSGRKTVILELDMRRPKMAEIFQLSNSHAGVSDFLNGTAVLEDIIQHSGTELYMDLISSGTLVQNPAELLEKGSLNYLIQTLRDTYDDIVIDTPPLHLVPDAMILSPLTDCTLYMVRQGFTPRSELDFVKELQSEKQLSNINIVFNGIKKNKFGYGYAYNKGYYQGRKKTNLASLLYDFADRF